ncbi:MAG: ribulose-phosphate 3-epimerase [Bacteroidetes bacterium]|nr:ribulose-phosphate 3-epimerase [Bacteroidota bacterium]
MAIVAPSLLSANFLHLERDCKMLDASEAEWFHLDVMDGRFVPNISFGPMIIKFIRQTSEKFFDVHLMIEEPEKYSEEFMKAGADSLTVHAEACVHLHRNIQQINQLGMRAGVAINPHTPVSVLENIINDVYVVCLMSVNPGFGGQSFIPQSLDKIKALKSLIESKNAATLIQVDGGVSEKNAAQIIAAGADVLVAGSAVFGSSNPAVTISKLKSF